MPTDPRRGLGGYVQDAAHGGFQIERARRLARDGILDWVAILLAEPAYVQRPVVLANRQMIDIWRDQLGQLGVSVGGWFVHGTDPFLDSSHTAAWRHLPFWICNAEDTYVQQPHYSNLFLEGISDGGRRDHPKLVLSTNGDPAQRAMDYRRWEQHGATLATQAYWQFGSTAALTPRVAFSHGYLPKQVNFGPSSTSWWYRIWIRGTGVRWAQSIGRDSASNIKLKQGRNVWRAKVIQGPNGGWYLTDRIIRGGKGVDSGKVLGFQAAPQVTPHVSNEGGDFGRPSPEEYANAYAAIPKVARHTAGVFTLDNALDADLIAIKKVLV